MCIRHAIVLAALIGSASAAGAQRLHIADVASARNVNAAQLEPATVAFSDKPGSDAADPDLDLIHFDDWATKRPVEKKYLALFPSYAEPLIGKMENGKAPDGSTKTEVQRALCLRGASSLRARPRAGRHRSGALCDAADPRAHRSGDQAQADHGRRRGAVQRRPRRRQR